jgi:uncharacterized membrane protein YfcA
MDATLITILQCLCVAFVAMLYAAVGHGGATGYIALLSLFGLQHEEIATTALILNTVVASISLTNYYRAGCFQLKQALPYLILSIPLAYIGARLPVDKHTFAYILGTLLTLAALRFAVLPNTSGNNDKTNNNNNNNNELPENEKIQAPPIVLAAGAGGILGLLSGIVGIGGGIFLSPLIIFKHWATTKQTSAISALFIVVNSISGLAGRFSDGKGEMVHLLPFLLVAAPAAIIGSTYGASKFTSKNLQRLLAIVLALAAIKLFQTS